jgi:hypothetical protein
MDNITPNSSFFCENGLFGAWPTQEQVDKLEKWGVNVFVNLANDNEKKVTPYTTSPDTEVISYPIPDRSIPRDKIRFCSLVIEVCRRLSLGKKVYIHCKGGHGRAGMLVAAVLAYKNKISAIEAIGLTTKFHSERKNMRKKWRDIGAPQTSDQKHFVSSLFPTHDTEEDLSPFKDIETEVEFYLNFFLRQTLLGKISGPRGSKLMKLREKLFSSWSRNFF